ncbi:MAG: metallophosphoesterase [Acidimicrobiia bacterium]
MAGESVRLVFAGDFGANDAANDTLSMISGLAPEALFVVGDLSYGQIRPEVAWCGYVLDRVGASVAVQLVVGNHEADGGDGGWIGDYAECLPDRVGSSGEYPLQYYSDFATKVRVVAIAPGLSVKGREFNYAPGSEDRRWLEQTVAEGRSHGLWIIVAHHKVCISAAEKTCEVSEELANWEAANADIVMMGHAHNYQRSHQLRCVRADRVVSGCIADADGVHLAGQGAVFVIAGIAGRHRPLHPGDSEADYFAATMGEGSDVWGHGVVVVEATDQLLVGNFVGSDTPYSDGFRIGR